MLKLLTIIDKWKNAFLFNLNWTFSEKCRSGCHGIKPHTFKYVDGTTYKYNLDGNIDVLLSTVEGQTSTTKIKATVLLTQQADCNQILRLQNVQVIGADGKVIRSIKF